MSDFTKLVPVISSQKNSAYLQRYLPKLEQCRLTTIDLITMESQQLSRVARIGVGDAKRLIEVISQELEADAGGPDMTAQDLSEKQRFISTGDDEIDELLEGGFMTGSLSEIVGESGIGKSQFLLTLLLSIQLPPHTGKSSIYISTETQMSTSRLVEIKNHLSQKFPAAPPLSLDRVHTITCQYLDTLEHVVRYQLPIAVERYNVGLIVVDSIAANFRGDGEGNKIKRLAQRNAEAARLGGMLKDLAVRHELAVVVSNQVADRFVGDLPLPQMSMAPPPFAQPQQQQQRQQQQRQAPPDGGDDTGQNPNASQRPLPASQGVKNMDLQGTPSLSQHTDERLDYLLTLDHQQRWFTGWGDDSVHCEDPILSDPFRWKTPALGFVWANVISCRVALLKGNEGHDGKMRRWIKVAFSPWAPSGRLLEYQVWEGGVRARLNADEEYGYIDQQAETVQQQQFSSNEKRNEYLTQLTRSSNDLAIEEFEELENYVQPKDQPEEREQILDDYKVQDEGKPAGGAEVLKEPEEPEGPQRVEQAVEDHEPPEESQPEPVDLIQYSTQRPVSDDEDNHNNYDRPQLLISKHQLPTATDTEEEAESFAKRPRVASVEIDHQLNTATAAEPESEPLPVPSQRSTRKRYSEEIADSEGEDEYDLEDF